MMRQRFLLGVWLALALTGPATRVHGQMVNPAIDREGEPFCYFSQPTDVIGVMDNREGTLVSPEGYLFTGFAEMMFFTGNPPEPVKQRVKTLRSGYLPIVEYQVIREGISYRFTLFAATLDGRPESPLMNFIRVRITNTGKGKQTAFFSTGHRYQNDVNTTWGRGDNRFHRPATAKYVGGYEQAGVEFSTAWEYGFGVDAALRDGKVVYLFPADPAPELRMTINTGYNEPQELGVYKMPVLPTTPVGVAVYALPLKPGEERTLDFKMPYEPIPADAALVAELRRATFDDYLGRTVAFWEDIFARGIDIAVPEDKVVNTFKANLVYDLIARDKIDSFYVQKVNEFQYDAFWLRDASYIVRMYDVSGYHDIARQCLDFFPRWQQQDGNFVSQGGQFDGWGQTLWAYGQHYRITRDRGFAERVYPSVVRAVEWLQASRAKDPLHVIPVTTPGDNEEITGHVTGHNFAALGGLKNVVAMAEGLGKSEDARAWRQEYDDYHAAVVQGVQRLARMNNGAMTPGMDSLGGYDWGNMESVYPEIVLDPHDPLVTATLEATRAKYQEGIMTYANGLWMHHYITLSNTETEVIRGDQRLALEELYSVLVHTSATHAGFEYGIRPWGTRDFGLNLAPHGWFAAKFRTLLRDMLVREEENELHLLSVLSPAWLRPGTGISVRRAPTYFGLTGLTLQSAPGKATILLENAFTRQEPERIVLHVPWFMNVSAVRVDGKARAVDATRITLPPSSQRVEIEWTMKSGVPKLSYERAVKEFTQEYRRRYDRFRKDGHE